MAKRVPSRPRRTRVYDANYNIGESYYKPALDRLDRKQFGSFRPEPTRDLSPSRRLRFADDTFDEDLTSARHRAARAITEDSIFDSKGSRVLKGLTFNSGFDEDIDEDVQASINRIRANRPKMQSLINDMDLEDSFSKVKKRANLDLGEKLLSIAGEDDAGTSIRARALKMVSRTEDIDQPVVASARSIVSSFKRTAISDTNDSVNSAASIRAKATKERLANIESEMTERSEKLLEREKRAANLKKILAENDIEEVQSLKKITL